MIYQVLTSRRDMFMSSRHREAVNPSIDANVGVARVSAGRGVLGAVHAAEQAIFVGVGSQRAFGVTSRPSVVFPTSRKV